MFRKSIFITIALISAAVGAHSLNPRELYNEMYPVETMKRDAFNICDEADPTFVRAVGVEREACLNGMPHAIAVALGRVRPGSALTMQGLTDPSREAELLMILAAMPPRQPITEPRSFANLAWVRALSQPCDDKRALPIVVDSTVQALPRPSGTGRAAALDSTIRKNLPPLPRGAKAALAQPDPLPVIPLAPDKPAAASPPSSHGNSGTIAAAAPLPAPDIGDKAAPAIVPLAPATNCGGA